LRSAADLVRAGLVPAEAETALAAVAARYAIAVPPDLAALITPGDPADPIARQVLPDATELISGADEWADPIGDAAHAPVKGIVHRYPDRVLLIPTLVCAVYCRFCFRRERIGPGGDDGLRGAELETALAYIRDRPAIREVVITGGDPLTLAPHRLGGIIRALDAIAGVRVIRLHTRVPVAAPERIDPEMLAALSCDKAVFVALHANHPREFTPAAVGAVRRLTGAGIAMVGQTVLLKGVNDDPATLEALMRAFVEARIKPYYLHHLDPAPGTARFRTSIAHGQALMRQLRGRVSGLCQPDYVLDITGGFGKSPIGPGYLSAEGDTVTDWRQQQHPLTGLR
jgi:lysine 2,3-aminomutase